MKKSLNLIPFLAFMSLASCSSENEASYDVVQLTNEIESRIDAFVDNNNQLMGEALKDFYSNDEKFYWVEDGKVQYPNKEVLTASLEGLVAVISASDMKILNRRIQVMNANSAMVFLEYEQAMTMTSGGGFNINGAMTVLLEKEENVWRFLIGHSSTKKERGG